MAYIDVDFNSDIATILEGLEANATKAHMIRDEIQKLKVDITPDQKEGLNSKNCPLKETTEEQIEEDVPSIRRTSKGPQARRQLLLLPLF